MAKQKNPPNPGLFSRVKDHWPILASAWVLAVIWSVTSPPVASPMKPETGTRARLTENQLVIKAYLRKRQKAAPSLNHLRAFARANDLSFYVYDGYGNRFDYMALDERHFVMRSFGRDKQQNRISVRADQGITRLGGRRAGTLAVEWPSEPQPRLYPAALLEGTGSPDNRWIAKVYLDRDTRSRRLVVRRRLRSAHVLIADHDAVEEFYWLPDSQRLVYTATGSHRHRDGLYLWDLENDKEENLIDLFDKSLNVTPTSQAPGLWLSLAGIDPSGPHVYMFAGVRTLNPLNPVAFFDPRSVVAVTVPLGSKPALRAVDLNRMDVSNLPLRHRIDVTEGLLNLDGANGAQKDWLRLGFSGELANALLQWQDFCESRSDTPLFPYALAYLASLYGEGAHLFAKYGHSESEVLRTYGTEVAQALADYDLAPTYLRGLAAYVYTNLMAGTPLPYTVASLSRRQVPGLPSSPVSERTQEQAAPEPTPEPTRPQQGLSPDKGATKTKGKAKGKQVGVPLKSLLKNEKSP